MAEIRPFRALRYDLARAGNPADLLASIDELRTPDGRARLCAKGRYNVAQLLGEQVPGEDAPGIKLRRWIREGRLRRDAEASFYAIDQTWAGATGRIVRRGFLGALQLDESGTGVRLLQAREPAAVMAAQLAELQAGISPVLALFDDPEDEVQQILTTARSAFPDLVVADEQGVEHRLFPIPGQWETQRLMRFMATRRVLIAGGQHAWDAALQHRVQRRAEGAGAGPWDYVLAHFASADAPGLEVQPLHRAVSGLPSFELTTFQRVLGEYFDVEPLGSLRDVPGIAAQLEAAGRRGPAVAVLSGGAARRRAGLVAVLRAPLGAPIPAPQDPRVDLSLITELAVKPALGLDLAINPLPPGVEAICGLEAALQRGRDKDVQLLLLFNSLSLADLRRLGQAGVTLPAQCMRLFPSPVAGPALYDLTV